jgi:hypothetical protein
VTRTEGWIAAAAAPSRRARHGASEWNSHWPGAVGCPTVHDWQFKFSECHSEKWASTRRGWYSAASGCGSQPIGLLQTISYD